MISPYQHFLGRYLSLPKPFSSSESGQLNLTLAGGLTLALTLGMFLGTLDTLARLLIHYL